MRNDDNHEPDDGTTASYMISPDYGDAFAWRRVEGVDSRYTLGADSGGWSGPHPISDALFQDLHEWYGRFCRADPWSGKHEMDWEAFHRDGVELARRVKAEVGPTAKVFYAKPIEDPGFLHQRLREILDDGSVLIFPDEPLTLSPDWGIELDESYDD